MLKKMIVCLMMGLCVFVGSGDFVASAKPSMPLEELIVGNNYRNIGPEDKDIILQFLMNGDEPMGFIVGRGSKKLKFGQLFLQFQFKDTGEPKTFGEYYFVTCKHSKKVDASCFLKVEDGGEIVKVYAMPMDNSKVIWEMHKEE